MSDSDLLGAGSGSTQSASQRRAHKKFVRRGSVFAPQGFADRDDDGSGAAVACDVLPHDRNEMEEP